MSMTAEMTNNRFYVCSLCHMHFIADESFDSRRVRHDEWHMKARKHGRNTTQGTPMYIESVTFPKDLLEQLLNRVTELEERIDYLTIHNEPEDHEEPYMGIEDDLDCPEVPYEEESN